MELFKNSFRELPKPLLTFILKGTLFLVVWKIAYLFFLQPNHIIDGWLTYALGTSVNWVSNKLLPHLQSSIQLVDKDILFSTLKNGTRSTVLLIADACNALELMMLYIGFILASTLPFRQQIRYLFPGIILIFITNVLRCLLLIYVAIFLPNAFVFAHHYLFTSIVYLLIFLMWRSYIKTWIQYENSK